MSGSMTAVPLPIRFPLASGEPTAAAVSGVPELSPIRLKLISIAVPEPNWRSGLVPLLLAAMIVLLIESNGFPKESSIKIPPPSPAALLSVMVTLLSVMFPEEVEMPPPLPLFPVERFPLTVLLFSEIAPVSL